VVVLMGRAKIKTYLNLPDTRALLGIEGKAAWEGCSESVGAAFMATLDPTGQTWLYVTELLERGVRVLNYVGTLDWSEYSFLFVANASLQLHGQRAVDGGPPVVGQGRVQCRQAPEVEGRRQGCGRVQDCRPSYCESRVGGVFAHTQFLKVFGAGHMVPMDQPKHSDAFVRDWLKAGSVGK